MIDRANAAKKKTKNKLETNYKCFKHYHHRNHVPFDRLDRHASVDADQRVSIKVCWAVGGSEKLREWACHRQAIYNRVRIGRAAKAGRTDGARGDLALEEDGRVRVEADRGVGSRLEVAQGHGSRGLRSRRRHIQSLE